VQEIPWTGQVGDSAQPLRLADQELKVGADGAVTLPMTGMNEMSAYQVILSPGGNGGVLDTPSVSWRQTYEAENATYTGSGYSKNGPEGTPTNVGGFATSGSYNVGGLRTGSDGVLAFDVDVPQDGTYGLSVFANSYNLYDLVKGQGPTNVFLRVDGADPQELRLPLGYTWVVWGHTDTQVKLTAGKHRITLAAKDPDLGVTKGDAIIDKIDLSLRDRHVTAPAVYEAEYPPSPEPGPATPTPAPRAPAPCHWPRATPRPSGAAPAPTVKRPCPSTTWAAAAQVSPSTLASSTCPRSEAASRAPTGSGCSCPAASTRSPSPASHMNWPSTGCGSPRPAAP
jgi:hypothetical protein